MAAMYITPAIAMYKTKGRKNEKKALTKASFLDAW
jgi:hypothetical protein